MLAFIDEIVIPFLNSLYGAVGYLGVMLAMAIESAMVPLPSELILPYAGLPRLRPEPDRAAHRRSRGTSGSSSIVATIGNTLGSLIAYAIGAYGGRPFLERYGKYLLIRPHEIELADAFFAKHGARDRVHRPAAADRPDVHQLPGRRRPDADRAVHRLLDGGRVHLVVPARLRGHRARARTGCRSARRSSRSTWPSRSWSCWPSSLFIWWRLGMPGRPGNAAARTTRRQPRAPQARRSSGGLTLRNSR